MNIHIGILTAVNCGTGISAPAGAQVSVGTYNAHNVGVVLQVRDPSGLLATLGLRPDTPPELLIDVLKSLERLRDRPQPEREQVVRSSKLAEWVGTASNLATLATVLVTAQMQGLASEVVRKLFG